MVEKLVAGCAAEMLAIFVDNTLADRWTEVGSTLAIAGVNGRRAANDLISLGRDPIQALASVPKMRCVAACLSGVGTAVRLDLPSSGHGAARVILAVTCCGSIALLRHSEGRVDRSLRFDGPLVELLRNWAEPIPCPACKINPAR